MSRFSFSRPSIITLSATLGFLLGLGLLFVGSEAIALLPRDLMDSIVRVPSLFGTDLNFLLAYFACFAAAGGLLGFTPSRNRKRSTENKPHLHQSPPSASRHSFTLIELLIVIAIIAVLATVVILALNPAQLLAQARDSNRVSDLATMNQALTLYNEDVGSGMGSSSVVYVSVPDPAATSSAGTDCASLGLASSSLPTGWAWHCAASSTYRKVNGTGWLPVDFTKVSSGSPLGSLPVDPVNTTSTGLYYAYVVNGDPWEMTAEMESQKYGMGGSHDVVSKDGGQYPDLYEVGTDLSLSPVDYDPSLVGYWKLDEGSGSTVIDSSANGDNGTWKGTPAGSGGTYYTSGQNQAYAGYFNGSNNYVSISSIAPDLTSNTLTAWIKTTSNAGYDNSDYKIPHDPIVWTNIYSIGSTLQAGFAVVSGKAAATIHWSTSGSGVGFNVTLNGSIPVDDNAWHQIVWVINKSSNTTALYVDGVLDVSGSLSGFTTNTQAISAIGYDTFWGGTDYFPGSIDDVRIYNRALSAAEIVALYDSKE
jgi:prepilin-type N-terminal cleavage/methylation domain-containing protein